MGSRPLRGPLPNRLETFIVKQKSKGQTIEVPEDEKEPSPVPDLMAVLEQTLDDVKAGG